MANNPPYNGLQPLRPPMPGPMDNPQNYGLPMPVQFRQVVPAQQSQQFLSVPVQQFQPVGQGVSTMHIGLPPQAQPPQYSQPVQHLPVRPGQPALGPAPSQAVPSPNVQPNRPVGAGSLPPQANNVQTPNNYAPGLSGAGASHPSSFTFTPTSYGQPPVNLNVTNQYQPVSQTVVPTFQILAAPQSVPPQPQAHPSASQMLPQQPLQMLAPRGQAGLPSENQDSTSAISVQHNDEQLYKSEEMASTDWKEHVNHEGKRYYHNKRTKESSWEKPLELMTPIERADATTDWREFTSPDGRKYYYNKVTKQSKWMIPEELKVAREQALKGSDKGSSVAVVTSVSSSAHAPPSETNSGAVAPVFIAADAQASATSVASVTDVPSSSIFMKVDDVQTTSVAVERDSSAAAREVNHATEPLNDSSNSRSQDVHKTADESPQQNLEKAKNDEVTIKPNDAVTEEKAIEQQPSIYANKLEAKNAFKALLESANVASDWTWDRAMRVIINDKRYGALKSLGERKQVFNEYLSQRKKQEAEERRARQKKAREDFRKMLEECKELTSSTRWSKAVDIFEDDERFRAVERDRDRKDLFDSYLEELDKKERAKAQEERKKNIIEYRKFLESCDFIKAHTQWRKVQDRLETDERCKRLEKIDRLDIFQDYINDLEKEEEEKRRMQKEELRKVERKNRDEFRKLLEEHVAEEILTAKTHWREYSMQVKGLPAYQAVISNTSGSTAEDLFDDVVEELKQQYQDDKSHIKDVVKLRKIPLSSTWTLEEFKEAISADVSSPPISDINLKLVFDDLVERAREKEEKEAKKRKRLEDDFLDLLCSIKEITASSKWDECKQFFEGSHVFSSIGDENICMEIFDGYVGQLKEKAKESERRRKDDKAKKEKEREERDKDKRKAKQRKEKERGREKKNDERVRKDGEDSTKKQRKRHHSNEDDSDEDVASHSMSSHRRSSERKKAKQHVSTPDSDTESEIRLKRHN